jgi:hypothetical protein
VLGCSNASYFRMRRIRVVTTPASECFDVIRFVSLKEDLERVINEQFLILHLVVIHVIFIPIVKLFIVTVHSSVRLLRIHVLAFVVSFLLYMVMLLGMRV